MLFAPRISTRKLAQLSRRLAMALEAGIDARTVWGREADRARGAARSRLQAVSRGVNQGEGMAEAVAAAGGYFPPLFREMVAVGDLSGHQSEVFYQLADHYDNQVTLRRNFLASITWPLAELAIAVAIVGFLIWVMGIIGERTGTPVDPLGFGLVGNRGLAIYAAIVGGAAALLYLIIEAIRNGGPWVGPVQRAVLHVPVLGPTLRTLTLARLAWSMHLTLQAGMDIRRALQLSLRSTRNARYVGQIARIDAAIGAGNSVYDAFAAAGGYPHEFLDALAVAEQSGRIVESMAVLSRQYQDRARAALATLTMLAGFAVWAAIAAIIIAVIFRLFGFYIGTLQDAMKL
jgi:type II secretory pathway component PulF